MDQDLLNSISGKRILFIGVKFYDYTSAVLQKLTEYGALVTFYYERDITFKHSLVENFFPNKVDQWQDYHFKKILKKTEGQQFDYFLSIRGYKMRPWFVDELRVQNPVIKAIMYQWYAYSTWNCDYRELLPHFDKSFTFDYRDADELKIKYVPTFHIDEISKLPKVTPEHDLFYYGNFVWHRYEFLLRLLAYAKEHNLTLKTHIYLSWFKFYKENFKGNKIERSLVSFKRINSPTYLDLFNKSKVIVDVTISSQSGLPMRMMDVLGAGKKVVTTNKYAYREPGFDPEQVVIFDEQNIKFPANLLDKTNFSRKDYSIDKFLSRLFVES